MKKILEKETEILEGVLFSKIQMASLVKSQGC